MNSNSVPSLYSNRTSHTYNEQRTAEIIDLIVGSFTNEFNSLYEKMGSLVEYEKTNE